MGLAVGDALGAPFEFQRRDAIPSPLPAFERTWMGLPPGTSTDDTAMARNLWLSLIHNDGSLVPEDLIARHLEWLESGPPDVGNLTRRVLSGYADGETEPARLYFERRGPEVSAGNGSVMYCAPLGVVRASSPERLLDEAPALSALTHWDQRCRTACLAVTLAVASLVGGGKAVNAVRGALGVSTSLEGGEELEYLVFTLFTAGSGLQVAAEGLGFEEGLRRVVGLGGDTDTNAAVAGTLLGAAHGVEAIPGEWLERLADGRQIREEAAELAVLI